MIETIAILLIMLLLLIVLVIMRLNSIEETMIELFDKTKEPIKEPAKLHRISLLRPKNDIERELDKIREEKNGRK